MHIGLYFVVKLIPDGVNGYRSEHHDEDMLDRDQALAVVNEDRPLAPSGTLYRLLELSDEEIDEIIRQDLEDDD